MYRTAIITALFAVLILATAAHAVPFSISYTADNSLTEFQYGLDGNPLVDVPGFVSEGTTAGSGSADWRTPATFSTILTPGNSYVFQWQITNFDGAPNGDLSNPSAFLADVTSPFATTISTSGSWEVAAGVYDAGSGTWSPGAWQAATPYALNDGSWFSDPSADIWYNAGGGELSGIASDAAWIGLGAYPGQSPTETTYARVSFTATPIPGAVWLLGSGLLSIVGIRRMRNAT